MSLSLGQRAYRPRSTTDDLRAIVNESLEDLVRVWDDRFRKTHGPLAPRVIDLLERFVPCGDPHFGFLRLRCPECALEKLVPFSCKARGLCPSCGQKRAVALAERLAVEVLPRVPYAPVVFTIPKMLRPHFRIDRALFGELCRTAYAVVRDHLARRARSVPDASSDLASHAVPAMVASPQSFGSLLNWHPHVHALVSLGVFDALGHFHLDLDLDFSALEERFRHAFLDRLVRRGTIDDARRRLLLSWLHSGFGVHADRVIEPGNITSLETTLSYMERPPVSLRRLSRTDLGLIVYEPVVQPGFCPAPVVETPLEFLARLVPHVHHRYECRLHTYGAVSTTWRRRWGRIGMHPGPGPVRPLSPSELGAPTDAPTAARPSDIDSTEDTEDDDTFLLGRRRNWARLIRKVWIDDPELCPRCHTQLAVVSFLVSPHQDDVIRAILKSRGEWNPPWLGRPPPTPDHARPPAAERRVVYDVDPDQVWTDDDFRQAPAADAEDPPDRQRA